MMGARRGSRVSSRLEDLRDLARMLDQGEISRTEYDIVKTELLEAPAQEWDQDESPVDALAMGATDPSSEPGEADTVFEGWRLALSRVPTAYRAALAGAVLILVIGVFFAGKSDASGTVEADPAWLASAATGPAPGSLGIRFSDLTDGWNAVSDPPLIVGGIMTSPEPGRLDSFLHRFDHFSIIAGAYDPIDGSVYALMVRADLLDESVANLYIHLCYLLHPGSQECLDAFIDAADLFGRTHADFLGTEHSAIWEFEGHSWRLDIADDVETVRVQGDPVN